MTDSKQVELRHGQHGTPDQLCGRPARTRDGEPCQNRAGLKTEHVGKGPCWVHGGRLPSIVKQYRKEAAAEECEKLGVLVEIDPHDALLLALYEAQGHSEWLRARLEDEQHIYELVTTSGEGWERTEKQISIWKDLWDKERERAAKLAMACIKAGIAEREVKLAENQADMLVTVIRAVLDDPALRLTQEQQAAANKVVPLQLRKVAG